MSTRHIDMWCQLFDFDTLFSWKSALVEYLTHTYQYHVIIFGKFGNHRTLTDAPDLGRSSMTGTCSSHDCWTSLIFSRCLHSLWHRGTVARWHRGTLSFHGHHRLRGGPGRSQVPLVGRATAFGGHAMRWRCPGVPPLPSGEVVGLTFTHLKRQFFNHLARKNLLTWFQNRRKNHMEEILHQLVTIGNYKTL